MGCIILLLTMISPRLVVFLVWVFNRTRWDLVFDNGIFLPLLGFLFLPFTTLIYIFAVNPLTGQISAFGWIWLILALIVDLSSYGGNAYRKYSTGKSSSNDVIDV